MAFEHITEVVDVETVMKFFMDDYKLKKGEKGKIVKREWYFDATKGKVIFMLTTDKDAS